MRGPGWPHAARKGIAVCALGGGWWLAGCVPRAEVNGAQAVRVAMAAVAKRETWAPQGHYEASQDRYDHGWRVQVYKVSDAPERARIAAPDPIATSYEVLVDRHGKLVLCTPVR